MFYPHQFKTSMAIKEMPEIILSIPAYQKIWHYVDKCELEIGWLGTVKRDGFKFIIQDVYLPKQDVTCITTTITEKGLSTLAEELLAEPNGTDIWNEIMFWGHSHVDMDTGASGTDDDQMELFERSKVPFFVRGIFNKLHQAEFTLFLYQEGLVIHDVPWRLETPEIEENLGDSIQEEIKAKLKRKKEKYLYSPEKWFNKFRYDVEEALEDTTPPNDVTDIASDEEIEDWLKGVKKTFRDPRKRKGKKVFFRRKS